jgi:hypothetical protein
MDVTYASTSDGQALSSEGLAHRPQFLALRGTCQYDLPAPGGALPKKVGGAFQRSQAGKVLGVENLMSR